MNFLQHYSGSKGNLFEVQAPGQGRILIECGGTWKSLLRSLNGDLHDIHGCLASHFHADHSSNYEKLTEFGIPIYATHQTFTVLPPVKRSRSLHEITPDKRFTVGPFSVTPFHTHHDAEGSVGFVVEQGTDALLFCTDSTHITESWDVPFTTVAIECSWDKARIEEGLASGKINSYYAKRLTTTHMEKAHTMLYLREYVDLSRCRELHLIHMSKTMDSEATRKEFEDEFMIPTFIK